MKEESYNKAIRVCCRMVADGALFFFGHEVTKTERCIKDYSKFFY